MLLRMKNGNIRLGNTSVLLDYLGVKKEVTGLQKVKEDVELIACVPFIKEQRMRICDAENKEQNQEGFAWTLSTFDLDRYAERIDPKGWDFKRYLENPVVEWAHRYDIPAIGKIENLTIDDNGLHGVVFFNDKEYDPFGWAIGERVKNGVIRAGSVGFRVLEIELPSKEDSQDGTDLIFRKQELLEFSICNVPANPFALAKTMSNEQVEMSNEQTQELSCPTFWGGLFNKF